MFSSLIVSLVLPYNFFTNKNLTPNNSFSKEMIPEPQYRELPLKMEITPEVLSPKQTQVALIS